MTYEERKRQNEFIKKNGNYFVIAIIGIIGSVFLPLLGSSISGGFNWPKTTLGWIIWAGSRISITIINVLIFYCFTSQAKVNSKEDPNFIEAQNIMNKISLDKELKAKSPEEFFGKQWSKKGVSLVLTSLFSTFVFSEAVLRFDISEFLSFVFTLSMGIIFGYITMRKDEEYWCSEYLMYAKQSQKEKEIINKTEVK